MARFLIIWADGIGTADLDADDGRSIMRKLVDKLVASLRHHGLNVTPIRVTWSASMAGVGGTKSWDEAAAEGVRDLDWLVESHPGEPLILLGYSGGCKVIHDWLDRHAGTSLLDRVLAVGLMSDPYRPRDRQQDKWPTRGWGIAGERVGPLGDRTFWTTMPGDVISDALPDAILRTGADASRAMPGGFVRSLVRHVNAGSLQLAWQIGVFQRSPLAWFAALGPRLAQARDDIHGYMTGRHTTAYTDPFGDGPSLIDRLAATVSWAARKRLS
jgi:hypothetical protein